MSIASKNNFFDHFSNCNVFVRTIGKQRHSGKEIERQVDPANTGDKSDSSQRHKLTDYHRF